MILKMELVKKKIKIGNSSKKNKKGKEKEKNRKTSSNLDNSIASASSLDNNLNGSHLIKKDNDIMNGLLNNSIPKSEVMSKLNEEIKAKNSKSNSNKKNKELDDDEVDSFEMNMLKKVETNMRNEEEM